MSFINKTVAGSSPKLPSAGSGSANLSSVGSDLQDLRAEVNALIGEFKDAAEDRAPEFKSRLQKLAGSVAGTVESEGSRLLDRAYGTTRELSGKAKEELVHARDYAEHYISDHPWRAVGAIAAATLAVSLLFTRRGE